MKKILLLCLSLFFIGCAMSNEAIIKEYEKCRAAGLGTTTERNKITENIIRVQCQP